MFPKVLGKDGLAHARGKSSTYDGENVRKSDTAHANQMPNTCHTVLFEHLAGRTRCSDVLTDGELELIAIRPKLLLREAVLERDWTVPTTL